MTYSLDPSVSWYRRSYENYNGLLKYNNTKKSHLSNFTNEKLEMIEDRLNHHSRKRLGFKTLLQMFNESFNRIAF